MVDRVKFFSVREDKRFSKYPIYFLNFLNALLSLNDFRLLLKKMSIDINKDNGRKKLLDFYFGGIVTKDLKEKGYKELYAETDIKGKKYSLKVLTDLKDIHKTKRVELKPKGFTLKIDEKKVNSIHSFTSKDSRKVQLYPREFLNFINALIKKEEVLKVIKKQKLDLTNVKDREKFLDDFYNFVKVEHNRDLKMDDYSIELEIGGVKYSLEVSTERGQVHKVLAVRVYPETIKLSGSTTADNKKEKVDNMSKITIKKESNLRPPNLALKGKKRKSNPTIKDEHTKKSKKIKDIKAPVIKGYLSEDESRDFFNTVFEASYKFHKEYKVNKFEKFKCGEGSSICLVGENEKPLKTREIVLDPKEWAFGEADLLTSLNAEVDGYTIKENCIPYVNSKAECIRTEDFLEYYKTHIGAFVLVNHKQDLKGVKGVILDVVLREITLGDESKIYYSRGLIAVNRKKDPELAKALEEGKVRYGSMGSFYSSVTCGYCGAEGFQSYQSDTRCIHLKMMKGLDYKRPDGSITKIVEWWNAHDEKGNKTPIELIEYSLLVCKDGKVGGVCTGVNPAWSGSVVKGKDETVKALKADKPIKIEVEEIFLKKPAFQMFLKDGGIKILKSGDK